MKSLRRALRKLGTRILVRIARLLGHETNASGNNMSQR